MDTFETAEHWVAMNYPNCTQEEKERLATAFISGVSQRRRKGRTIKGYIARDINYNYSLRFDLGSEESIKLPYRLFCAEKFTDNPLEVMVTIDTIG